MNRGSSQFVVFWDKENCPRILKSAIFEECFSTKKLILDVQKNRETLKSANFETVNYGDILYKINFAHVRHDLVNLVDSLPLAAATLHFLVVWWSWVPINKSWLSTLHSVWGEKLRRPAFLFVFSTSKLSKIKDKSMFYLILKVSKTRLPLWEFSNDVTFIINLCTEFLENAEMETFLEHYQI